MVCLEEKYQYRFLLPEVHCSITGEYSTTPQLEIFREDELKLDDLRVAGNLLGGRQWLNIIGQKGPTWVLRMYEIYLINTWQK